MIRSGGRPGALRARLIAVGALLATAALVSVAPPATAAPPSNDDIADAAPLLLDSPTTVVPDEATSEPGEGAVSQCDTGHPKTVWFAITPEVTTSYSLSLGGGSRFAKSQILLGVFSGPATSPAMADLTQVDCGNNTGYDSIVDLAFTALAGSTYYVQVGVAGNADEHRELPFTATVVDRPVADDFADRQSLEGASGSLAVDNSLASPEPDEPTGGAGHSLWYSWTAPDTGDYQFTTDNVSDYVDTFLVLYSGAALDDLTPVATDDDVQPGRFGYGVESRVTFHADAGETFTVLVDGAAKANRFLNEGSFQLIWGPPATTTTTTLTAPATARVGRVVRLVAEVTTSDGEPASGTVEFDGLPADSPRGETTVKHLHSGSASIRVRLPAPGRSRFDVYTFNDPDQAPSSDHAVIRVRKKA